jgi:hypothetical protein
MHHLSLQASHLAIGSFYQPSTWIYTCAPAIYIICIYICIFRGIYINKLIKHTHIYIYIHTHSKSCVCVCAHLNLQLPQLSKSSKYPPIHHGTSTSSAGRLFSKVATCPATHQREGATGQPHGIAKYNGKSVKIVY